MKIAAFFSVLKGSRPTCGEPGSAAPTMSVAVRFFCLRMAAMAGWYWASTWKSTNPLICSLISVLRLPTATGPFMLSTVVRTVTQPTLAAACLSPWPTLTANGWLSEKTS